MSFGLRVHGAVLRASTGAGLLAAALQRLAECTLGAKIASSVYNSIWSL